jgi:hypothetical protein
MPIEEQEPEQGQDASERHRIPVREVPPADGDTEGDEHENRERRTEEVSIELVQIKADESHGAERRQGNAPGHGVEAKGVLRAPEVLVAEL